MEGKRHRKLLISINDYRELETWDRTRISILPSIWKSMESIKNTSGLDMASSGPLVQTIGAQLKDLTTKTFFH